MVLFHNQRILLGVEAEAARFDSFFSSSDQSAIWKFGSPSLHFCPYESATTLASNMGLFTLEARRGQGAEAAPAILGVPHRSPPSVGPRTLRPQVQSVTRSVEAKGPLEAGLLKGSGGTAGRGGSGWPRAGPLAPAVWLRWCLRRWSLRMKLLPQTVQVKGRTPVWVR